MARTFIDVIDQGDYLPIGELLSAYGVHKQILALQRDDMNKFSAKELNRLVPLIHFNKYHVDEDGLPKGAARVLKVTWTDPAKDARGDAPVVRLRELAFGDQGSNMTIRKRYTAQEIYDMCTKKET